MKSLCCASSCVAIILFLLLNGRFHQWVGGCLEDERGALLLLRDSVPSDYNESHNPMSTWKGEDCCQWDGITCSNSTRQVVGIYLQLIDLSRFANYTLFAVFKELQDLAFSGVGMTGAEQMLNVTCKLKHLRMLNLSNNSIDNSIPPCLCDNQILETMDLHSNRLKGSIPSCLGSMESLQNLDLSYNQLTGNIPCSIFSNLTMMDSIDISNNKLSGMFSFSTLANLSMLTHVDLSNNVQLEVDTESPSWVPSFLLDSLILANCNLNKQTSFIPSFISSQYSLYHLDLSHNSLEGKIPDWLLYNISSEILLRGNKLVGPLPSPPVQNVSAQVIFLDISDNRFSGPLSANNDFFGSNTLRILKMSSNIALYGEIPESMISMKDHLQALDLSKNKLSGEMPQWLATNNSVLKILILSKNKFQGDMLPKDSKMTELLMLCLDGNNFTGSIPASLVNIPNLTILDVGGNNISGDISNWFPSTSRLKVLFLRRNNLKGEIPRHLCFLQQLRFLDFSGNLFSGDIPSCLLNITSMAKENYEPPEGYWTKIDSEKPLSDEYTSYCALSPTCTPEGRRRSPYPRPYTRNAIYGTILFEVQFNTKGASYIFTGKPVEGMIGIDLSFNQLTGSIPTEIGHLEGLRLLNLSHNSLIGPIPTSFGNLKSLECLDLSYNHINGTIPPEVARLDSLGMLNVSFNNLSGEIPSGGHFLTLNDPTSYMGNSGLCGRELENHCSPDNDTPSISHDKDDGEEKSSIMDSSLPFYSSMAISYILGFWGVITLLIFKKNWRYKLFKLVDVLLDGRYDKIWATHFYLKNHFHCC